MSDLPPTLCEGAANPVILPLRGSKEWWDVRDKLLAVPKPAVDHPNNWLGYFDELNDEIQALCGEQVPTFVPEVGSIWQHKTRGQLYVVEQTANHLDDAKFPLTVVYRNTYNDTVWTRLASDWLRSFTLHSKARND